MFKIVVENFEKDTIHKVASKEELLLFLKNLDVNTLTGSLQFNNGSYLIFSQVNTSELTDLIENQNIKKLLFQENVNEKIVSTTEGLQSKNLWV